MFDNSRVRVLPPLDPAIFRAMQQAAIAVLDPFPVGLHLPILDAMMDGIPVVSCCFEPWDEVKQ